MEEEIHFGTEAEGVAKDVQQCVKEISVSTVLPASRECAYINLVTKENQVHCVKLDRQGFRIVSNRFDEVDGNMDTRHFETIYSLLDKISPGYIKSFGESLASKLAEIKQTSEENEHV